MTDRNVAIYLTVTATEFAAIQAAADAAGLSVEAWFVEMLGK